MGENEGFKVENPELVVELDDALTAHEHLQALVQAKRANHEETLQCYRGALESFVHTSLPAEVIEENDQPEKGPLAQP